MTVRVGINGFGRIGRMIFRASQNRKNIDVVAINDLLSIDYIYYLLKFDSTHGRFNGSIKNYVNYLLINDKIVNVTSESDINRLNWRNSNVDVVIDATGLFTDKLMLQKHLSSGAKKVIVTAPTSSDDIPMFVRGVNFDLYNGQSIISNASCTTNCLAPIAKIINEKFGIIEGLMTTIHASTATQKVVDSPSIRDWRSGRGVMQNIIPASTGAAKAVGKVLPELSGKLTGISFRVPIPNVSVVDFTVRLLTPTSYKGICKAIKNASMNEMKNIISYTEEKVVSSDFNGETATSVFDANAGISLNDNFFKLIAWYDNETGYSNKILDLVELVSV